MIQLGTVTNWAVTSVLGKSTQNLGTFCLPEACFAAISRHKYVLSHFLHFCPLDSRKIIQWFPPYPLTLEVPSSSPSRLLSLPWQSFTFLSSSLECQEPLVGVSEWAESSSEAYGGSFASGDFWIDNNRLQMAINGIFKNVLMVLKKWKSRHIMPLVANNYGGACFA